MKSIGKQRLALFLLICPILLTTFVFAYSSEEKQAYNYAFRNDITTMESIDRADMGGTLTRIAMAKMISNYAINVLGLTPDRGENCYFSDVSDDLDYKYDRGVTKACQLGLMGVGINKFYPNGVVTRAEFGTVLSRALNAGNQSKLRRMNNASPYYEQHLQYLKGEGIMSNISNPSSLERRGRVMLMLMRADESYGGGSIINDECTAREMLECITMEDIEDCMAACEGQ